MRADRWRHPVLIVLLAAVFLVPARSASGREMVRLAVLPFEINAPEELSYLSEDVSRLLSDHLRGAGAAIIQEGRTGRPWTPEEVRRVAAQIGADGAIWGSLTVLGDRFSIDARYLNTEKTVPPTSVFVAGDGIENLLGAVRKVARELEIEIFQREKVAEVAVAGNQRIETDAIRRVIQTEPGDILSNERLSRDIRSIYRMGYFEDIRVETDQHPNGRTVTFHVTEKPTIRVIRIEGAGRGYDEKKIKENLDIQTGSILNISKVQRNLQRIESLYKEKNFHNVSVDYNVVYLKNNQADLEFIIDEGEKIKIRRISIEGNSAYSDEELKDLMKTSEKGFFSFITKSGELSREDLDRDAAALSAFYQNNGYIQARVSDPEVTFKDEWIEVSIKVEEGLRFRFGEIDIEGELILPKDRLLEKLTISQEVFYNRERVRSDVLRLKTMYADQGYANADVTPRIHRDEENQKVDITYTIDKGSLVYFERINIAGNQKTRDKVIRRELRVYEKELFSETRLKRSIQNLYRLDYFEDVRVDTPKGSADDQMILNIDVTDKSTGSFTFGGGYSTVEDFFLSGGLQQRNLFGKGQILSLDAQVGGRTQRVSLRFTEPWLFDIPLSAGFDFYNWLYRYEDYDKDSTGGRLRASYPVWKNTRAYLSYRYDVSEVQDIEADAARSIQELEGKNATSSITPELRYDSRDKRFNTTRGSKHSFSVEYAGGVMGGDIGFVKTLAETGWYLPLWWDHVFFIHGEGGWIFENGDGLLPDYERFYLGGMNSIRGFDWQDIHATDEYGDSIGGEKYIQGNVEYQIPLFKDAGIVGVLFFDIGNVYGKDENIDLGNTRESAGLGVRWYSPVGPIRLEYGHRLDPLPGEETGGQWEFSMGSVF
ncbi:MAG: outer membrane protein assembly factor BamA [Desulfobacterales bacterium]|nr:outer membrane protein assembly factor BamA [Desulfobacterales bacterium]